MGLDEVAKLYNLWRDLGAILDNVQPGLINPLPDTDPDYLDAWKVAYHADQIRMEVKL